MIHSIKTMGFLSIVSLSLFIGCGGSSSSAPQTEQLAKENNSATETKAEVEKTQNIIAQSESMSILPREATGDGDYYLAPTVKFAKVGLGNYVEELVYVDENGDNHYGIENIFKTELKTFGLNLYYDSSNARDNYSTMGHWRNSFVSQLDFPINAEDIKDKSNFYETPREACESGFGDIKETIYRGILSEATSVYDKNSDSCVIKQEGEDIGTFLVWNRTQKRDDVHYLTTGDGEFLVFTKNDDGNFTTEQDGLQIALVEEQNGSFSYKDSQDILRKYNSNGQLFYIMKEGQETYVEYNEDGDITKVKGAMDNVIEFSYDDNALLSKVTTQDVRAEFAYTDRKMLKSYNVIATDVNKTEHNVVTLNFTYNEKNLLEKVVSPEMNFSDGESRPESIAYYTYDDLNRLSMLNNDANLEQYSYDKIRVIKRLSDGSAANVEIAFAGSKQIIKAVQDAVVTSSMKYNKEGRLSELNLEELVESNTSANIESNALTAKTTLKIQMDYNQKGLISAQYLESSDGKKKFTNFEYKTKYNKPTKVLSDEDVTFFDFNNKGQLIKMSYLKFEKDMKLKSHALEDIKDEVGFQELSYQYDENGMLMKTVDEVTGDDRNFFTLKNGQSVQGNIKENGLFGWWHSSFGSNWRDRFIKGKVNGTVYNVRDNNTKFAIVSGGGGESGKDLYRVNDRIPLVNAQHFHWESISYSRYLRQDIFDKGSLAKLVVVGHSYGGDSAVEGACAPRLNKKVDLLITVDPVGRQHSLWYARSRTNYWVNIYADAGRQFPGLKVKWRCKWFRCYPKVYRLKSQWNTSDWIAFAGGKGTYSSYGKHVPADKRVTVRAHHEEVCKMINTMQNEGINYDFTIRTKKCK
ncbi:MAG: hypothetical protein K0U38_08755 [Epsilonproteobacteria bacterium]|nr:hypothetical protein [Campylobacterota bacterium]